MKKIIAGILLNLAGLTLIIFRWPALGNLAGKTRVKLGLFFGMDRVHTALSAMIIIGFGMILLGDLLIFLWFRCRSAKSPVKV